MTKALAANYRESILDNGIDLISGNVKIAGMDSGYVYSVAHNFADDLSDIIATTGNLTTKTKVDGYFNSDGASLGSPAAGDTITQFWLYRDSGTPATSELVAYWNEDGSGSAIALETDGTEKTVNPGALGWFRV